MALTDAQKRANAADIARRKALGDVKVTVWLSAQAKVRLDELTAKFGTRQKALETALMGVTYYSVPPPVAAPARVVAPAPVKPVQQAEKPVAKPSKAKSRLKGEWKAP